MPEAALAATVRDAVTNLVCLYVHALDRRQWDLFDQVFFDDGACAVGIEAIPWRTWRDAARRNFTACLEYTHHQVSPPLINFDGQVAWCETYCTAHHRVRPDAPADGKFKGTGEPYDIVTGLRYSDRIEARDGTWRIAHRQGVVDWRGQSPARDVTFYGSEFRGRHDQEPMTDPVVARWRRG